MSAASQKMARELVDEFKKHVESDPFLSTDPEASIGDTITQNAKKCALAAVDKIKFQINYMMKHGYADVDAHACIDFWESVENDIVAIEFKLSSPNQHVGI